MARREKEVIAVAMVTMSTQHTRKDTIYTLHIKLMEYWATRFSLPPWTNYNTSFKSNKNTPKGFYIPAQGNALGFEYSLWSPVRRDKFKLAHNLNCC